MKNNLDLGARPSLKEMVYQALHDMIIRGELKPGARITEEELSNAMRISRAPIREGLNMLERDGFVEIIPRKGAIISPITKKFAENIWMCRLALEPFASKEATTNIPKQELTQLRSKLEDVLAFPTDIDQYVSTDLELHGLFYQYVDNDIMRGILENLRQHSTRVRWLNEHKDTDVSDITLSTKEHILIVDAIDSGDGNAVFRAVETHLLNSKKRVTNHL